MKYSITVSFRCPPDLERRVRVEAAKKDKNRTEFIIDALQEKLERIDASSQSIQDRT